MTPDKPMTFLATAAVIPLAALAIAGCGGSGNDSSGSSTPPKTANGQQATIGVADNGTLGKILDDANGRTLYLFKKDSGTRSACSGACASAWPPLRVSGKPVVGTGATATLVGTTPRSDGKAQVTYNGHPLYTFAGDQNPGDTNGQGLTNFGGGWYALSPSGHQVSGTAPGSGSSSSGGYGY
jgi:predicted lipoprotein with Yx(FWY)xxD motif